MNVGSKRDSSKASAMMPFDSGLPPEVRHRVSMTVSCRDTDSVPKVPQAGEVVEQAGERVQIMHEGTRVIADGYCGGWMTAVIHGLRGHHEPQEELLFHHLLAHVRPDSLMVELGSYWAYYTNWYLGAVPGSRAICVEPDPAHLELGRRNLDLNDRSATFVQAFVGRRTAAPDGCVRDCSTPEVDSLDCLDMDALLDRAGGDAIEMLHMDVQGYETAFIESMQRAVLADKVRFIVVSTHHESISGSPTTHADCLAALTAIGATVFAEHDAFESYSGDGLIVASFSQADRRIVLPAISRNVREQSLFPADPAAIVALSPRGWLQRKVANLSRWSRKLLRGSTGCRAA